MKPLRQNCTRSAYILSNVPKPFDRTAQTTLQKTSIRPFQRPLFITPNPGTRSRLPTASVAALNQNVRTYTKADETSVEKLASSLASAFEDDPMFRYIYPLNSGDILSNNKAFMLTVLNLELSRPDGQTTVHVSEEDDTVAIWHHVGHWKAPFTLELLFMFTMFRILKWKAFRFLNIMQIVEDFHPTEPHMHLFIIGTHAASRGRGHGSKVIAKMLDYCDLEGIPAYLESSNEKNLSFYRRHGFEVFKKVPGLPDDCPPLFAMWRDPKPVSVTEEAAKEVGVVNFT